MKVIGIQRFDGPRGLSFTLASGRQILLTLPEDRREAAEAVGEQLLELIDDANVPHCTLKNDPSAQPRTDHEPDDVLSDLDAGLEVGRLIWHTLQLVSRRRGR